MPKFFLYYVLVPVFVFFLFFSLAGPSQAQLSCSSGTWQSPTCDPTSGDPSSCNVRPPLFSGAACVQGTGFLRVADYYSGSESQQSTWVELLPGSIQVGDVQAGWPSCATKNPITNECEPPAGAIEALGPIISGNFISNPYYRGSGDISVLSDIYAGGKLRIEGTATLNSPLFVKGVPTSVGGGQLVPAVLYVQNSAGSGSNPTIYVEQVSGSTGDMLYLNGRNGDVYFDAAGYMNALNNYFINSTDNLQLRIDSDQATVPGNNTFAINNGSNSNILTLDEGGNMTVTGDLSGVDITASGNILGNYLESSGGTCDRGPLGEDQVLVYRQSSDSWVCVNDSSVGGSNQDLLSVLNTGSDASAFTGTSSFGGDLEIKANATNPDATLAIFDELNNDTVGSVLGEIKFGDAYGGNQAKIRVERGAIGSGGDYPTNLSFWTTPDGSASPAQRLTVNYNGYVGIGTAQPSSDLDIYDTIPTLTLTTSQTSGDGVDMGVVRGTIAGWATVPAAQIKLQAAGTWGLGSNPGRIVFMTVPAGSASPQERMRIESNGYVGIGTANPAAPLHLATSTAGAQNILRIDGPTAGVQLQSNDSRFDIVSYGGTAAGYDPLFLRTGANGIWITTTGNVNLGAVNPTISARLKIDPITNTEGLRIISSNYSPLIVRNSADTADLFRVDQNGDGTLLGTLTVNKLQVNTIDPVYAIRGEKYATYVAGMTGVKEETAGLIKLVLDAQSGLASASLDFNSLDKGSDLWLFAQTINYKDNFDKIVVLLTPAFDGRVWYEKDETTKTLTIIAKPINKYSQQYEVSYRLTGPRFDYQQWPNKSAEDTEGLNLDDFHSLK